MATEMCEKYFRDNAEQQVNVNDSQRSSVLKAVDARTVDANTFAAARKEVFQLMNRDSYKRFKGTQPFRDLLEELGSYDAQHLGNADDVEIDVDVAMQGARCRSSTAGQLSYMQATRAKLNVAKSSTGRSLSAQLDKVQMEQYKSTSSLSPRVTTTSTSSTRDTLPDLTPEPRKSDSQSDSARSSVDATPTLTMTVEAPTPALAVTVEAPEEAEAAL